MTNILTSYSLRIKSTIIFCGLKYLITSSVDFTELMIVIISNDDAKLGKSEKFLWDIRGDLLVWTFWDKMRQHETNQ